MEVKDSEAQGRRREAGSEGSVEQRYAPTDKNWIRSLRRRTSRQMATKSVSIKDAAGKSGGPVSKAVERLGFVISPAGSPLLGVRRKLLGLCPGRPIFLCSSTATAPNVSWMRVLPNCSTN